MIPGDTPNARALDRALDAFLAPLAGALPGEEVFARRVARFLGLASPPHRAAPVLRALGVEVLRVPLSAGLRAVWTVHEGRYRIRASVFLAPSHWDLTLWHEWFEIVAARPAFPAHLTGRALEAEADRFAALLMMPADAVLAAAAPLPPGKRIPVLAARFAVDAASIGRRLAELSLSR